MGKLLNGLNRLNEFLVGLSIATISIVIMMQVFNRFVLNSPLSWPEEFSRIVFIFLVFLGGALATRRKSHISVEVMDYLNLSKKMEAFFEVIRSILMGAVMYATLYGGLKIIPISARMRLPATGLSMSIMVVPIVICSGLIILWLLVNVVETLTDAFKAPASEELSQ